MIEPQVLMTVSNLGGFISRRGHQFLMVGISKKKKKKKKKKKNAWRHYHFAQDVLLLKYVAPANVTVGFHFGIFFAPPVFSQ